MIGITGNTVGCSIIKKTSYSLGAGSEENIFWDTGDETVFDTHGFHSHSTNADRIIIPAGLGGVYIVNACVQFSLNASGSRRLKLRFFKSNGVAYSVLPSAALFAVSNMETCVNITSGPVLMEGLDYFVVAAIQSAGVPLNIVGEAPYRTFVNIFRIAA